MTDIQKSVTVEVALLKALAIQEHYQNYINYVNFDRLLPETQVLLRSYEEYYKLYPEHVTVNFDTFMTQFCVNWHAQDMHQDDVNFYRAAIQQLKED